MSERDDLTALNEALRTIAEHDHPDSCDGVCADNLREIARDALKSLTARDTE